ncbi:hypothetical protein CWE15_00900 [Aliidiomarina taiwanensis]|uniref:Uncharacterized protein n=1 Tax=Aliidiomarina taiwanensis TaxID=946228 RepID=A0A432X8Z1_9GAMM|nr:hypothetical protein [Aliidiomarina taiwanensis]RUO43790.1 hypothetical protein CWE15_00900 [Aliidiomarina taiwanensis]
MNMWTEMQAAALDKLGIPLYQRNQAAASPAEQAELKASPVSEAVTRTEPTQSSALGTHHKPASAEANDQVEMQAQPILYQLGPWLLAFPHVLPVNYYPWLKDLSHFVESRPTQVSQAGTRPIIDCTFVAKETLSQTEKRALWQQLKPYLAQSNS